MLGRNLLQHFAGVSVFDPDNRRMGFAVPAEGKLPILAEQFCLVRCAYRGYYFSGARFSGRRRRRVDSHDRNASIDCIDLHMRHSFAGDLARTEKHIGSDAPKFRRIVMRLIVAIFAITAATAMAADPPSVERQREAVARQMEASLAAQRESVARQVGAKSTKEFISFSRRRGGPLLRRPLRQRTVLLWRMRSSQP